MVASRVVRRLFAEREGVDLAVAARLAAFRRVDDGTVASSAVVAALRKTGLEPDLRGLGRSRGEHRRLVDDPVQVEAEARVAQLREEHECSRVDLRAFNETSDRLVVGRLVLPGNVELDAGDPHAEV